MLVIPFALSVLARTSSSRGSRELVRESSESIQEYNALKTNVQKIILRQNLVPRCMVPDVGLLPHSKRPSAPRGPLRPTSVSR